MAESYKELKVWKMGMELVTSIYQNTKKNSREELYGLSSQIRKAAVSIPSNIAEGHGRRTSGEFLQFLVQARGSLLEVETQVQIAVNLGYLAEKECGELMVKTSLLGKSLNPFIEVVKLQRNPKKAVS
jgi:four helix bundle protein